MTVSPFEATTGIEEPAPNLPLLRKVLDHIDAHPEEWNQNNWGFESRCGTACCVAGHAMVISGYTFGNWQIFNPNGVLVHDVEAIAATLLGIDAYEANELFRGKNTREDVQRVAEGIALRDGERL